MRKHLRKALGWPTLFLVIVCALSFMGSSVSRSVIQVKADLNRDLANILSVVKVAQKMGVDPIT